MAIAVVVGASGSIGHAIANRLVDDGRWSRVIALTRRPMHGWDDWISTDVLDEQSLAVAAAHLADTCPLTRIVVATGLLHDAGLAPEKSMRGLSLEAMTRLFAINAVGPALAAKHLLRLTPRGATSLFAALSARVGSIGDNRLGGWYSYRASKAALNMLIRTLAIEHHRTRPLGICVALHPGTVDTPLSAPFQANVPDGKLFTPDYAAAQLMSVMDGLTPDDNGGFFGWDGAAIPW